MSRKVQGKTCPTCGHDHGTVQTFDIPEIPILDDVTGKQILTGIEDLKGKVAAPANPCADGSCDHAKQLGVVKKELAEEKASHPVLTPEYLRTQREKCPNCKAGIETFLAEEIRAQGLVKPEPKPAETKPERRGWQKDEE